MILLPDNTPADVCSNNDLTNSRGKATPGNLNLAGGSDARSVMEGVHLVKSIDTTNWKNTVNSSQAANFLALSQVCSYSSLESKELKHWAEEMRPHWDENQTGMVVPLHRKIWEWAFIASTLAGQHMLKPGIRGLGFGVATVGAEMRYNEI
ncbi:MAG: hypothetical protein HKL84_10080 [Acidimicrobiaceae bacterium]|nr:hypothetical protein [Acidimicrobiaceae bacterium]